MKQFRPQSNKDASNGQQQGTSSNFYVPREEDLSSLFDWKSAAPTPDLIVVAIQKKPDFQQIPDSENTQKYYWISLIQVSKGTECALWREDPSPPSFSLA